MSIFASFSSNCLAISEVFLTFAHHKGNVQCKLIGSFEYMSISKTRQKLVDVARQLFAKNGLENTTMNDIAQSSGKGRRTLYTYFKSKEDIYYAVIESELERLSDSWTRLPPNAFHLRRRSSNLFICI